MTDLVAQDDPVSPRIAHWLLRGDVLTLTIDNNEQIPTADEIYEIVFEDFKTFRGIALANSRFPDGMKFSRYPAKMEAKIAFGPSDKGSGLACVVNATTDVGSAEIANLRDRKANHIVIAGQWFPFASGAIEEVLKVLDAAGVADAGPLTLRQYLALRRKSTDLPWLHDQTKTQVIHPGINSIPAEGGLALFAGDLFPYQRAGWQWLTYIWREGLGAILADEMGLGKTIQVIALLSTSERDRVAPSLIVAPSTLLENWRREIKKFAPTLRTHVHQGAQRTGHYRDLAAYDVIVTTYDTVVRDGGMFPND